MVPCESWSHLDWATSIETGLDHLKEDLLIEITGLQWVLKQFGCGMGDEAELKFVLAAVTQTLKL
jgi:hypothetical protein